MKQISKREELLLRWIFRCVVLQSEPLNRWINDFLKENGSLWADPGFRIDRVANLDGVDCYEVLADPDVSGIDPSDAVYSVNDFRRILKETLLAFADECGERACEVKELIEAYNL